MGIIVTETTIITEIITMAITIITVTGILQTLQQQSESLKHKQTIATLDLRKHRHKLDSQKHIREQITLM